MKSLLATLLLAGPAWAGTDIVGDAWILGKVAVGTGTASARWTVAASSADTAAFQVSGVDLTPFLRVAADGTVGISTYSTARVDVWGVADNFDTALMLRSGDLYGQSAGRSQLLFGENGTASRRHAISSLHYNATHYNSIDFKVWRPSDGGAIATTNVLSLVTSTATMVSAHVRPGSAEPAVELVVSNGSTTGGGSIHVGNQYTPSSRRLKTDIVYLDQAAAKAAYDEVRGLKHASFRYMKQSRGGFVRDRRAPMRRGLIFEEAPQSVRAAGESLSLDDRLLNGELAFQELSRRLEALEREVGP